MTRKCKVSSKLLALDYRNKKRREGDKWRGKRRQMGKEDWGEQLPWACGGTEVWYIYISKPQSQHN